MQARVPKWVRGFQEILYLLCFFEKLLLLNGYKKSFVCLNTNQQDRITNNLVLAGSQPGSIEMVLAAVATPLAFHVWN